MSLGKDVNVVVSADSNGGKDDRLGSFPSLSKAFCSPSTTSLAATICDLENQMLEGKLVLAGYDWKPLKHSNEASNIDDVGGTSN
nr:hypothetical protein [Tanacetum cinerariifolium]